MKAKENGTIGRLIDDTKEVEGNINELRRKAQYLKKGRGRMSAKDLVKAIRNLTTSKIYTKDGTERKNYSPTVAVIKIVKDAPFEYEEEPLFRPLNLGQK